jgi:flagellar biogenesis protein FliO
LAADMGTSSDIFVSAVKMLAGFCLVGGLLFVLHALHRKGFKFFSSKKQGDIKIHGITSLGGKNTLYLVEVKGREFLLGASGERLEMLYTFDSPPGTSSFEKTLQQKRED